MVQKQLRKGDSLSEKVFLKISQISQEIVKMMTRLINKVWKHSFADILQNRDSQVSQISQENTGVGVSF